jgi:hypothetical protein
MLRACRMDGGTTLVWLDNGRVLTPLWFWES